ncbi:MAG: hypothetical protein ACOX6V_05065 [Patescibacteria group bacterium]|jgi:hypothetical protein
MKLTDKQKDEIYENVFNILSSTYEQAVDDSGEATYTFDDEGRDTIMTEL